MSIPRVLDIARQELVSGVREPQAYSRYAGGRQEPWCGHFASWVFAQAGTPLPYYRAPSPSVTNPLAATTYAWTAFRELGKTTQTPQPGDLIFYKRNEGGVLSSSKMGHVGIVTSVDGSTVTSIEGNLSDRVMEVRHDLSDPSIAGYARPVGGVFGPGAGIGKALVVAGLAVGAALVLRNKV